MRAAEGCAQSFEFLAGLKSLHQHYWIARGQPGAFANPYFEKFHRALVSGATERGEIQLLAVDAGAHRLGFLYNFVHRGRVYNYQSGFNYQPQEKHDRPGLVAHMQAILFNAARGLDAYDFLAGDAAYKRALGTHSAAIFWVVVQRSRLRFRIEAAARALRDFRRR